MDSLHADFKKTIYYNKINFKIKNVKLLKSICIKYYVKKNISSGKKKLKNDFYKLFKEFETFSMILPKIYKINLKYTNKKKKIKTKVFTKIVLNLNKEVHNVFNILFIKHFFFYINSLEKLKFKKYMYLEEVIKNKIDLKIKINKDFLIFNILVLKNMFNFCKKILREKNPKRYKTIFLKIKIKSSNIIFFFKFIAFLILNNYKINLYYYKKFLSKKKN